MKRLLIISLFVLGLVSCQTKSEPVSVTLVQYNVGVFDKYEGSGFDAVANVINELGADVVSLNELDSCTTRTGSVDQIAKLAEVMGGWNSLFAPALDSYKGGKYGVGVVSKPSMEVLKKETLKLPKLDGREDRALAVVEYKDFVMCSTHLDLTLESQLGQIKAINEYIDSKYAEIGKPVFLAGDFNNFPGSEPIVLVEETWTLLTPTEFSFPSHAPDRCIDYIFVRPNGKKVTVESTAIPQTLQTADLATASDHLPVVLKVTIE
jgi:endonuclease/exonuclease/phosphatase family metal-dependent hydrolase